MVDLVSILLIIYQPKDILDSDVAGYWSSGRRNVKFDYVSKQVRKFLQMFPPNTIFHIKTAENFWIL